jgi:hypothetical protein
MSDGTHLLNFADDMTESPVYMIIGNLWSKIRQMLSTRSVVMVALLPILIKNRNIPQKRLDEQRQTPREVLNEVVRWVLHPVTFKKIPTPSPCITMFSVQMATSGVGSRFKQHGLLIALSIPTYIISSAMYVFGASVQRTNLEIMCRLTSNTPDGIETCIQCSGMPTPRQPMPNSRRAMFTYDSPSFDIFPAF